MLFPALPGVLLGVLAGEKVSNTRFEVIMANMEDVRATGHKTPGESSVNITVSIYDTTHLQENPQRIG